MTDLKIYILTCVYAHMIIPKHPEMDGIIQQLWAEAKGYGINGFENV